MTRFTTAALVALTATMLSGPVLAQSANLDVSSQTAANTDLDAAVTFLPIDPMATDDTGLFGVAIAESENVLGADLVTTDGMTAGTVHGVETRLDGGQRLIIESNAELGAYLERFSLAAPARLTNDGDVPLSVTYAQLMAEVQAAANAQVSPMGDSAGDQAAKAAADVDMDDAAAQGTAGTNTTETSDGSMIKTHAAAVEQSEDIDKDDANAQNNAGVKN